MFFTINFFINYEIAADSYVQIWIEIHISTMLKKYVISNSPVVDSEILFEKTNSNISSIFQK